MGDKQAAGQTYRLWYKIKAQEAASIPVLFSRLKEPLQQGQAGMALLCSQSWTTASSEDEEEKVFIARFFRKQSKHRGLCLFPSPMEFPPGKMNDAENHPSRGTWQHPLWHLPDVQTANPTESQKERLSLGASSAQEVEKGQCGYPTSYSPLSLWAPGARPENTRPAQHIGGIQPLAAAAAALQSISRHKRCKDRDEVVFPSFSRCRQALRSTYTEPEAFRVIHCEIRWRTEMECMWQRCEQQQRGSKGLAEMHGTGLGQAKWPANPPAYWGQVIQVHTLSEKTTQVIW